MKGLHRSTWILLVALAAPVWAAQAPADLAAAFGALPQQSDVVLSPSGSTLAWQQRGASGLEVVIYDLRAHAVRRTLRIEPSWRLRWLRWEDGGTLLMGVRFPLGLPGVQDWGVGRRPIPVSLVVAVDIASGRSRELLVDRMVTSGVVSDGSDTVDSFTSMAHLLAWHIPQAHTVIMSTETWSGNRYRSGTGTLIHNTRRDSGFVSALFSVDTRTGADKPLAYGDAFTDQWVIDADGQPVARSEWHSHGRRYAIYALQGNDWRNIFQRTDGAHPRLLHFDAAAHAILASMPDRGGQWRVWMIPLDGAAPEPMLPTVKQGVLSVAFSRYTGRPTEVWVGGAHPHWHWLDPAAQMRFESAAHAFPDLTVSVYDHSRDGKEVLAEVHGAGGPPIYYLINFATHRAMIAGETYPQLDHVSFGNVHTIHYRLRGGRSVSAQEFLPARAERDLPLVVLVPGGPVADGSGGFDWFAQYLAARGYLVLQPEITLTPLDLSGGWSMWGGASQRYAIDGVHMLIKEGVADPHRVCIAGVGYGGYAALAGAAFFPTTYSCAVSVNGVSDLHAFLEHAHDSFDGARPDPTVLAPWRAAIGSLSDPKVIAESPVRAARDVVAPVLLIHDEGDTVVPATQSLEMRRALQKLGKPVTFIGLKGADHRLMHGRTRVEVLKAIGTFLQRYLH